jgi:hypothetical protein
MPELLQLEHIIGFLKSTVFSNEKTLMNPNVASELRYALKAHRGERLLMVMNTTALKTIYRSTCATRKDPCFTTF